MARKSRKVKQNSELVSAPVVVQKALNRIPTAVYARLSVEKEDDNSIDTQVAFIQDYIMGHPELELVDTYIDHGYTGTNFDRPDFIRLMDDVRTGKISCIVVKDLSRFGRNFLETGYYIETLLPRLNVRLISVNDHFDSAREEDRNSIAVPIKNMVNEMYAKDFSRKVTAYNDLHRKLGDVKILRSNYGYSLDREKNCYVVNPDTAPIVQLIFRWYLLGNTTGMIADRLNTMGILTPLKYKETVERGLPFEQEDHWNNARIRDILRNTVYIGTLTWGKRRKTLYKNVPEHKTPKEEWTICENMHEPLISNEDFYEVQRRMDAMAEKQKMKEQDYFTYNPEDLFQGKVYCAECGKKMLYMKFCYQNRDGAYYYCQGECTHGKRKSIHADFLKLVVSDQINQLVQMLCDRKTLLDKFMAEKRRNGGTTRIERKVRRLCLCLEQIEGKLATLYENYVEGILTQTDYQEIKAHYLNEKEKLQKELAEAEQEQKQEKLQVERFLDLQKHYEKYLSDSSFNTELVQELVESIHVSDKQGIEIRFTCEDICHAVDHMLEEGES